MRSFAVSLLAKAAASASPSFDPVRATLRGFAPTSLLQRRYRIDATILLFGGPLFRRTNVGGGYASVETGCKDGSQALALQFAAGSDPMRAHGLNRFGILQEALAPRGGSTELAFSGLMTRSSEESFEQGRKALQSVSRGAHGVLARGRTFGSTIRTWIDPIDLGADRRWTNLSDTLGEALRLGPAAPPREAQQGSATTFLCAMRQAALRPDAAVSCDFTHAGKIYRLDLRRRPERACEMAGAIHNSRGERTAEFSVTYSPEDPSGIPVRIEYRPRSFLRLTFEPEAEANQPPVPSVFHQESA